MTRRIYIAGLYDAPTAEERAANVEAADDMARELAERGHEGSRLSGGTGIPHMASDSGWRPLTAAAKTGRIGIR